MIVPAELFLGDTTEMEQWPDAFQFLGFLTTPHPYITDTYEIPDCAPIYSIGGTKVSLIQSSRLSAIQRLIIEYLMTPIQQTLINLSARLSTATLESMMLD